MSSNGNKTKGLLIGLLTGGAIGAIVVLLTTPKSGKEIRNDIKLKSEEYLEDAERYYNDTKEKANDLIAEGKRKYLKIVNDIKSKPEDFLKDAERVYSDALSKTKDVISSGKDKLQHETERVKSSVKAGVDAYNETNKS